MARALVATLVVLAAHAFPAAPRDDYPKDPNVDIEHYRFALELTDSTDMIRGTATITARFRRDGITRLRLDLVDSMSVGGDGDGDGQGMTVDRVTVGSEQVPFTHADRVLLVHIPPSTRGGRMAVTVQYHGVPATGLIIGPNKHGDRTFFSDNWPDKARHWLPTVDHPYDKATAEMMVTAPSRYQVISNGLLVEQTDLAGDRRRTLWRQSVPIATWLYALGVARFAVQQVDDYEGRAIQTWVYPEDRDAGFHDFAVPTKDVMAFFGDRVGPYAYEKLANVQSNSVRGGMEAATAIFYGDDAVTGTREVRWRNVIIHEVAHQWFGNAVTESDWDDVWLSEGFATYFTLLFIEHAYGRDAFVEGLRQSRERILQFYRDRPDYRVVHDDLADMSQVTTAMQYQKGAWTLHMLRQLLGTEVFWRGIQRYYARYMNGNATTDDFRQAMEEASGRDLLAFFQQWLYQGGIPHVEGSWRFDPTRREVTIDLRQVVADTRFLLTVPVAVFYPDGSTAREALTLAEEPVRIVLPSPTAPDRVALDPDVQVLMAEAFGPAPP